MNLSSSSDSPAMRDSVQRFGVPLSDFEQYLGSDLVRLRIPAGIEHPLVQALDIYDAQSGEAGGEGVLLSLISAEAMRDEELERALEFAAASGCVGVAYKSVDAPRAVDSIDRLSERIDSAGLSAVILAPQLSWREFDALVTRLLGESAQSLALAPSGADRLFALANTIARVFRGSVAIENHQRDILAHSSVRDQAMDELRTSGILFRRAGDAPVNEQRYREVLAAEGIVRFEGYHEFLPRAAIAVRAGAIPLGTIWALDPEGAAPDQHPMSGEKEQILLEGAALAADAMFEIWNAGNREGSRREAAFKRLLVTAMQPGDRELLDATGDTQGILLVCRVPKGPNAAARIAEIRAALARYLATFLPDLILIVDGAEIIALCRTIQPEAVHRWVLTALSEVPDDLHQGVSVGLSDPHTIATRLPYAADEARSVATSAEQSGQHVGTVDRVRVQLFFAACQAQLEFDDRLLLPEVRDLLEESTNRPHLVETLECWLEEAGNVARTAKRLQVHEQTVRYRLRKIRERLPLESRGPDFLLAVWTQLRALRVSGSY